MSIFNKQPPPIYYQLFEFLNVIKGFIKIEHDGFLSNLFILHFIQDDAQKINPVVRNSICPNSDLVFMDALKAFRQKHPHKLIVCHLNLNSLRNKFTEMSDVCVRNTVDILFLSETKIDASFPSAQFAVPGFKCIRADRNSNGGGIVSYIRSDIAHRRRHDIEAVVCEPVESLIIEVIIKGQKWLFSCLYNPHFRYKTQCCKSINDISHETERENISLAFIIGDLNINLLSDTGSQYLNDVMEINGLKNIIKEATCFKSNEPTLIDVVLTTNANRVASTININTGLSDFHNLVGMATKVSFPRLDYRKFDDDIFKRDIAHAPFHVAEIFDDLDDKFWFHETLSN